MQLDIVKAFDAKRYNQKKSESTADRFIMEPMPPESDCCAPVYQRNNPGT